MSKKTRRRGSRRSRNPMVRTGAKRLKMGRRSRRRNPSRRFRNPMPVVRELFGSDMLTFAGGVVLANIGTTMIMNRLNAPGANGQRSFDLPFVDYSMLANPTTAGMFYQRNAWSLAIYKLAIGGTAGYLLRNQSPRLSRGILVGTLATAISDVLRNTGVLTPQGTLQLSRPAGTGRNFRAGTGFIPGTNTQLTGPAQQFLTLNNVPRPRGMGARVGPGTVRAMSNAVEPANRGAN